MAEEGEPNRKRKGPFDRAGRNSKNVHQENRRPLKTYPLLPPNYIIDQSLLEDYVEYEVKFAGVIPDVKVEVDVTNRTDVLKIIDRGKKRKQIPYHIGYQLDAIFSLSKNEVKIKKRDAQEELILRVPIYEIAAVCYIKDDGLHMLSVKYGYPDNCKLAVLYCEDQLKGVQGPAYSGQRLAEGICSQVNQCFQLVYTEATIQILEETVERAAQNMSMNSSTESSTLIYSRSDNLPTESSRYNRDTRPPSERSNESGQAELLKDYMSQLHQKLQVHELHQLAALMRSRTEQPKLPFNEYCDKVYKLYGPERKHLLLGMCPFIPEKDYPYFEEFLKRNGIGLSENGHGTLSSYHSFPRIYTRSISDVSVASNLANGSEIDMTRGDEVGSVLDDISAQFERIDASVGNMNINAYLQ